MSENNNKTPKKGVYFVIIFVVLVILGAIGRHAQEELQKTTVPSISVPSFSLTPASTLPVIPPTDDADDKTDEPYYGTFTGRIYRNNRAGLALILPDGFTGSLENEEFSAESDTCYFNVFFTDGFDFDVSSLDDEDIVNEIKKSFADQDDFLFSSTLDTAEIAGMSYRCLHGYGEDFYVRYYFRQIDQQLCQLLIAADTESEIDQFLSRIHPY